MDRNISFDSLSARGMLHELWQHAWMIVLFSLSVYLGVTGIGNLLYTPMYTVSSTVVVGVKGSNDVYSSLSTATQMADVISEVFQSEVMLNLVKEDTGKQMSASITCSQIEETNLLVIDAIAKNPKDAYEFLNAALQHYDEVSSYVFSNASLEILKEPSVPTSPSNQPPLSKWKYHLTLLGAIGMSCIILLFYMFRFTLKSSTNASKQLDGEILGVIPYEKKPKEKKNKVALLISSRIVTMNYAEACRRVQIRLEHALKRKNQQVLLISSVGENEGKSTIAANITIAFGEKHQRVLLIDGDLLKPAQYKVFERNVDHAHSLQTVLQGKVDVLDALSYNKDTNVYELFSSHALKNTQRVLDIHVLTEMLDELKQYMDYIIIDCSPISVSTDAEVWMQVVQSTSLIVRQDYADIRVINDTVDMITQSGSDFSGFILNAFQEEVTHTNAYDYAQ